MPKSYLSPKTKVQKSKVEGQGLFAIRPIKKGEIVAIKGGHIFDRKTLNKIESEIDNAHHQIEENFFIGPLKKSEIKENKCFLNHSCDPNLGMRGDIIWVALRDIKSGEELTFDYAMTDFNLGSMKCTCDTKKCRKIIKGDDWKKPELQKRYEGYFAAFLQSKIKN